MDKKKLEDMEALLDDLKEDGVSVELVDNKLIISDEFILSESYRGDFELCTKKGKVLDYFYELTDSNRVPSANINYAIKQYRSKLKLQRERRRRRKEIVQNVIMDKIAQNIRKDMAKTAGWNISIEFCTAEEDIRCAWISWKDPIKISIGLSNTDLRCVISNIDNYTIKENLRLDDPEFDPELIKKSIVKLIKSSKKAMTKIHFIKQDLEEEVRNELSKVTK
jgi:hypothetical protein